MQDWGGIFVFGSYSFLIILIAGLLMILKSGIFLSTCIFLVFCSMESYRRTSENDRWLNTSTEVYCDVRKNLCLTVVHVHNTITQHNSIDTRNHLAQSFMVILWVYQTLWLFVSNKSCYICAIRDPLGAGILYVMCSCHVLHKSDTTPLSIL